MTDWQNVSEVAVYQMQDGNYPGNIGPGLRNEVYDAVCSSWYLLGLDKEHYDSEEWNPLGEFIRPGIVNMMVFPVSN